MKRCCDRATPVRRKRRRPLREATWPLTEEAGYDAKTLAPQRFFKPPLISTVRGLAIGSRSPIFVMHLFRGRSMRIHPILDAGEGCFFRTCNVRDFRDFSACGPVFSGPKPYEGDGRHANRERIELDVNHVLLKRAMAGLLSRMRTFDWQIIHGHIVGGADRRGAKLDVLA